MPPAITFRTTTLTIIIASLLAGCATPQGSNGKSVLTNPFVSDDPCANTSRNIGIAVGAIGGAVIGHYTGNKKNSALLGSLLGGTIGGLIGYSMDKKRCELARLAQKHQLELTFSAIDSHGELVEAEKNSKIDDNTLGHTVSITDKENHGGHFLPGSDKLSSQAEAYFTELARIYHPDRVTEDESDTGKRVELRKLAMQRKLLLIGHTDDTGSSAFNAELSERRARTVARFLSRHGIPEDMLYYQGAGETFPLADNRLDTGRAQNRRVELVELGDETRFRAYLETRTPRYEFYRNDTTAAGMTISKPGDDVRLTAAESKTAGKPGSRHKSSAGAGHQPKAATPSDKSRNTSSTIEQVATTDKPSKPATSGKAASTAVTTKAASPDISHAPASSPPVKPPAGSAPRADNRRAASSSGLDFGGNPVSSKSAELDVGRITPAHTGGFISKAWADDTPLTGHCAGDRPRISGQVKVLSTGKNYATSDYLPGLYNTSWVEKVNGHLVALNKLAVLRQDAQLARLPELLVYANYQNDPNAKATLKLTPQVNTYRGSKGLLYRVFVNHGSGLQCIDLVLPYSPPFTARGGYVYQKKPDGLYRAPYAPKIAGS